MRDESRSLEDEIGAGIRKLLIGAAVCALAGVGSVIVGTIADYTSIGMIQQAPQLTGRSPWAPNPGAGDDLFGPEISTTMRLEAGREYLLLGEAFMTAHMADGKVSVSITSDSGMTAQLDPGSGVGGIRGRAVVGSFTVPETDYYKIVVSSTVYEIDGMVVDASIRAYQAAITLIPVGLVLLVVAFALFVAWSVRKQQHFEDKQVGAAWARSRITRHTPPPAPIDVPPAEVGPQ